MRQRVAKLLAAVLLIIAGVAVTAVAAGALSADDSPTPTPTVVNTGDAAWWD